MVSDAYGGFRFRVSFSSHHAKKRCRRSALPAHSKTAPQRHGLRWQRPPRPATPLFRLKPIVSDAYGGLRFHVSFSSRNVKALSPLRSASALQDVTGRHKSAVASRRDTAFPYFAIENGSFYVTFTRFC
jgi:hypothetical protein